MIQVDFQHWRYAFPDRLLVKYGSPHFSLTAAGGAYAEHVLENAALVDEFHTQFSPAQIVAGNEAFPENAVADPLADLEVWDEWKQGTRYFPYPGRYSKLGITQQEQKTSCPASVGVLGEIMAGYFGQAGVSPWILVRVVRQWPDFIFSHPNGMYSFVESKAFTTKPWGKHGLQTRLIEVHLTEGSYHAAQQLNSDPFGRVWYCLTQIRGVTPMELGVTLVEFNVSEEKRTSQTVRIVPAAVASGLAERAINQAAAKLGLTEVGEVPFRPHKSVDLFQELKNLAQHEIGGLLDEVEDDAVIQIDREPIVEAVDVLLLKLRRKRKRPTSGEEQTGRRFLAARERAAESRLSPLRAFSPLREERERTLFLADLPPDEVAAIRREWKQEWRAVSQPWRVLDGTELWRCGGAVIGIGPSYLAGTQIGREHPLPPAS